MASAPANTPVDVPARTGNARIGRVRADLTNFSRCEQRRIPDPAAFLRPGIPIDSRVGAYNNPNATRRRTIMTTIDLHLPTARGLTPRRSFGAWLKAADLGLARALDQLLDWQDRARQRRQLLGLSDAALQDFAASRADAVAEGGKPSWRA